MTLCSSYEKQGRNLLFPWRHWAPFVRPLKGLGIKIEVWENPVVYASTRDWSSLYGAIRSEPETAAQSSCSHFQFWVSLGTLTLSLFCMDCSGCSYWDASGEFCLPSLRVLSFSAWALKKKKKKKVSVAARQSVHPSECSPTLPSSSGLCVPRIENEQQSTVGEVSQSLKVMALARSAGEPCACREKFGPRPIFKIFALDQIRVDQEKKEVRKRRASIYRTSPSDAVEHFLVSHVTGWAILGYPALKLDTGIFPFVFFFLDTVLPRSSNLNLKKKMPYQESELGARRSLSGFRLATRVLERQWTLAPFYRWYKKMEQKVAGSIPDAQPLFTPSTHVRKQSLPVWHDERATRPYAHWHLFCCTKSSERCDVDHVGVSGNLCKTTTPHAWWK